MKRNTIAAFSALLLITALAAFAGDTSNVTVENRSDWVIEELYLAPVDDDDWGYDQLAEDILEPGDTFTLTKVPCDYWDILIVDEDGDECVLEDVDLCNHEATWSITNRELLSCIEDTDDGD